MAITQSASGASGEVPPSVGGAAALSTAASAAATPTDPATLENLLNLDIDQLTTVRVAGQSRETNLNAPSNLLDGAANLNAESTTGEFLANSPSVTTRRTSAINLDPRVRGYNSGELNATANGMPELKTRPDIDSAFSQIDPGIVSDVTIIDGPYSSLYGPGFAFLAADLLPAPRYETPQMHFDSTFVYGSNAGSIYDRDTVAGGGKDWGVVVSYGLRDGSDYLTGGQNPYKVPSSYQQWGDYAAVSFDLNRRARIEVDCIHTEMNNVLLPGVVYDLNNSKNDQFNVRYIVQEDPKGPQQLVLQAWWNQTFYNGDASRPSKQETFYQPFITTTFFGLPIDTFGAGFLESTGVRALRTFGERDSVQWTVGVDWRHTQTAYTETNLHIDGSSQLFGIPDSLSDDFGLLSELNVPLNDRCSFSIGGRIDQSMASEDHTSPLVLPWIDTTPVSSPEYTLGMGYITEKIRLDDAWTLNGGAAWAMRTPDLTELYCVSTYVPIVRFGNSMTNGFSNLLPEQDLQFDLGLTYKGKNGSLGIRGFYAFIKDYITPVPWLIFSGTVVPQPHVLGRNFQYFPPQQQIIFNPANANADTNQVDYQYANVDLASLCGGDLTAEYNLTDRITVFGDVSYVLGTNYDPVYWVESANFNNSQKVPLGFHEGLPGMYPLNGVLGVRLHDPKSDRWMVEFDSHMVSQQTFVATSLSEIPTAGFEVFNLRGYYRVNEHLRLTAEFDNLLNRAYNEPGSLAIIGPNGLPTFLPEPGFSAIFGVDAKF